MATRTAVIGAGAMGKGHLRSLASVPAAQGSQVSAPPAETVPVPQGTQAPPETP